ncbi:MAG: sigma-54-dependent Fis family transcriptional regulator [Gammaproteobacteria bacterium]|nr:sigma-54-dependent Fis family transcriptional regulator [Gammaproteobacteria bacterium]
MARQSTQPSATDVKRRGLLFVDDDPLIVESLSVALQSEYEIHTAEGRKQTKELLHRLDDKPSLALVDLGLPPYPHSPEEGFELIDELLAFNPNMKILVLSGQSEQPNIQHALTLGAVDFIPKPCNVPLLRTRLAHQAMMLDAEQAQGGGETSGEGLRGESQAVQDLLALIRQFADSPFPILIQGESGSGKELVARYLHEWSQRVREPFLSVNCAAFPRDLLEAQLFGYAKGAFTGAVQNRSGFFEDAGDGSLFLDEIGEMPLDLQSKLLRALENGEFYRLGETQARTSRARIIAATNRDLRGEVRRGAFRSDLYHRLGVLAIRVPPLRERGRDCLALLDHFRAMYAGDGPQFRLDPAAAEFLLNYAFPGNVRELRNIVIRLGAKYPGKTVSVDLLGGEVELDLVTSLAEPAGPEDAELEGELRGGKFRLDEYLEGWERRYIATALKLSGGNLSKAARLLGINRTTLYSRMQRLSLRGLE